MKLFDAFKTVYGPQSSGTTPLLSVDGTSLLIDKEAILKRWAEQHFDGVLFNQPSSINEQLSTDYHRWILLLDEFPTVSESNKTPIIWQGSKIRCNTCRKKLTGISHIILEKKLSLKKSRMHQLSTYSNVKGILKSMTIIGASLYCQLL